MQKCCNTGLPSEKKMHRVRERKLQAQQDHLAALLDTTALVLPN